MFETLLTSRTFQDEPESGHEDETADQDEIDDNIHGEEIDADYIYGPSMPAEQDDIVLSDTEIALQVLRYLSNML
jgi:hypothetical protein